MHWRKHIYPVNDISNIIYIFVSSVGKENKKTTSEIQFH